MSCTPAEGSQPGCNIMHASLIPRIGDFSKVRAECSCMKQGVKLCRQRPTTTAYCEEIMNRAQHVAFLIHYPSLNLQLPLVISCSFGLSLLGASTLSKLEAWTAITRPWSSSSTTRPPELQNATTMRQLPSMMQPA